MFGQNGVIPTLNHAISVHRVRQQLKHGELRITLISLHLRPREGY